MTPVSGGTETIRGWYHALITWALVAAVAAVIVFAGMWALGNIRSTPQTASRGKWGVIVAVVACMLLGGSQVYLQTLYDKWAPGFQPDPASYAVDDAPQADRYEVINLSDPWNEAITKYRAEAGWIQPVTTDPTLVRLATACARALSGATGGADCATDAPFWRTTYNSAELSKLDGAPTKEQIPFLLNKNPDTRAGGADVVGAAFVAVKDRDTMHAKLVALFAIAACTPSNCPQAMILQRPPMGNEDVPDQPQLGGG